MLHEYLILNYSIPTSKFDLDPWLGFAGIETNSMKNLNLVLFDNYREIQYQFGRIDGTKFL